MFTTSEEIEEQIIYVQVEIRCGWPRERTTPAQRLPFEEDQWRKKPLKNLIGLIRPQNAKKVLTFTERFTQGEHRHLICIVL